MTLKRYAAKRDVNERALIDALAAGDHIETISSAFNLCNVWVMRFDFLAAHRRAAEALAALEAYESAVLALGQALRRLSADLKDGVEAPQQAYLTNHIEWMTARRAALAAGDWPALDKMAEDLQPALLPLFGLRLMQEIDIRRALKAREEKS